MEFADLVHSGRERLQESKTVSLEVTQDIFRH
jgi:hypothetical protein